MSNPIVTIEMENGDVMKAELYPEIAPNTVNNFISLVKKSFYDGLIFHRVIPGFMIQGGDPQGKGIGGPGYSIRGEFRQNGFQNDLKHERGVLSMARAMAPNSAGSQLCGLWQAYRGDRGGGPHLRCAHRLERQAPHPSSDEARHCGDLRRGLSRAGKVLKQNCRGGACPSRTS